MNAKSVGSNYTEEQKSRFKFLIRKMREEKEKLESESTWIEGPYDEHFFNGLPKE